MEIKIFEANDTFDLLISATLDKEDKVCAKEIAISIDKNNLISDLYVDGGCSGNASGLGALMVGIPVNEVINKLEGITCGKKITSCPDKIAEILKKYVEIKEKDEK